MPRPRSDIVADALERPSLEDELRATANWLVSRTLSPVPDLPIFYIPLDPDFAKRIAGWLAAFADRVEGDA